MTDRLIVNARLEAMEALTAIRGSDPEADCAIAIRHLATAVRDLSIVLEALDEGLESLGERVEQPDWRQRR